MNPLLMILSILKEAALNEQGSGNVGPSFRSAIKLCCNLSPQAATLRASLNLWTKRQRQVEHIPPYCSHLQPL